MLIFYVKSFVHPRWLIKSADKNPKDPHNQKTINLEINTWNSFRDDLGFMTSSFVAIKKLLSEKQLFMSLTNNLSPFIRIAIDSNGSKQRISFNIETKKIKPSLDFSNFINHVKRKEDTYETELIMKSINILLVKILQ